MPGISIGNLSPCLGNRSQSWQAYWLSRNYTERVDHYFGSNLVAHWPLNETSGVFAAARGNVPLSNNMCANGGIEGFNVEEWGVAGGTVSKTTTEGEFHSGLSALKLLRTSGAAFTSKKVSVRPGQKYRLKFWCRGDGTNSVIYYISKQDYSAIIGDTNTGVSGTEFIEITSAEFTAPANFYNVIIGFKTANAVGAIAFIDDISLIPSSAISILDLGGEYMKATLNQSGFRAGENSIYLDGSAGSGVGISKLLSNMFPQAGGTVLIWCKPDLAALTDGVARWCLKFKTVFSSPDSNYADMYVASTANNIGFQFKDDTMTGTSYSKSQTTSEWLCMGMTWDASGGLKRYVNGIQVGDTVAISGTWTKVFNGMILSLGSGTTASDNGNWKGYLSHAVLGKTALSADAMKWLGQPLSA
jgi:hypothetical protein